MKRNIDINTILKPLSECPHQAYLSNALQVADVLEWILGQVGKAEIWQTSFSISEEFLRRLYFITRNGTASAIHLVLDFKATNKTLSLWTFIEQVISTTHLADNHSKVLLILSERGDKITVITSQNLTRGNRNESYIITSLPEVFDKFLKDIEYLIENKAVPLSDILQQKLQQ